MSSSDPPLRTEAVHGARVVAPDPEHELGLAAQLRRERSPAELSALFGRFRDGEDPLDQMMRRVILRALVRRLGDGLQVSAQVSFRNPETFEIGAGVFLGPQAYLQGCPGGRMLIGDRTWIGPQSYFDARDVELGECVGWGPGAKVLCSEHVGLPTETPIIETPLEIGPVRIEDWADVGTNAIIMPGVTVGRGSIVGAGAVVTRDVPPFAVVAGVPARVLRYREGHAPA